jgi:hypothetical protein
MHFDEVFLPVESGSLVDRPQWQGIDDPKPNGVSLCGLSAAKSLKRKIWTIGTTILSGALHLAGCRGVERGAIRFCFR